MDSFADCVMKIDTASLAGLSDGDLARVKLAVQSRGPVLPYPEMNPMQVKILKLKDGTEYRNKLITRLKAGEPI